MGITYGLSPANGAPASQRWSFNSGYSNTTTTIKLGSCVALDIANTTDGAGFVPVAAKLFGSVIGITTDTLAPGGGTPATGIYTDKIVSKGIVNALVQLTTGGVQPGDKLIPATGGILNWSAAAAAAVSQANFTFVGAATTTSDLALVQVQVNL